MTTRDEAFRRIVRTVALLNLGYFAVEFAVARTIGSVSLFADSVDFMEDAAVNFLILAAMGWTRQRRAKVGMALLPWAASCSAETLIPDFPNGL